MIESNYFGGVKMKKVKEKFVYHLNINGKGKTLYVQIGSTLYSLHAEYEIKPIDIKNFEVRKDIINCEPITLKK